MNKVLIITGATASGKSLIAEKIAQTYNGEIVNCDSKQIYHNLPILTAIPINSHNIPHHLYSYIDITQPYSVHMWKELVNKNIQKIIERNKLPILVGGTGLYIHAIKNGLSCIPNISHTTEEYVKNVFCNMSNNELYQYISKVDTENIIQKHDRYRLLRAISIFCETKTAPSIVKKQYPPTPLPYNFFTFVVTKDRNELYSDINQRFLEMINKGVISEAKTIINIYDDLPYTSKSIIGLQNIIEHLKGSYSLEHTIKLVQQKTRQYAKRQLTWFRHQLPDAYPIYNFHDINDIISDNNIL